MSAQPQSTSDRTLIAHLKALSVADRLAMNDKAVNVALALRRAFAAERVIERK